MSTIAPPTAKETAAAKGILRKLVALVARAYYEPKHIIVLDLLSRVNSQRDEELARALRVQSKELHKVCGKLKSDGLVKVEARGEQIGPAVENRPQRKINRSYYYIDYKHFVDVVKWKIYKIGKMIEKEVQMQMANMPYKCPVCNKEFSALDFAMLDKTANMVPLCDVCRVEIQQGSAGLDSTGVSEKYTKFMNESQPIVELLKQTDKLVIPEWISDAKLADAGGSRPEERELSYSQEQGASIGNIVIEVEDEKPKAGDEDDEEFEDIAPDGNGITDDPLAQYYANLERTASWDSTSGRRESGEDGTPSPSKTTGGEEPNGKRKRDSIEEDDLPSPKKVASDIPQIAVLDDDEFEDEDFEEI